MNIFKTCHLWCFSLPRSNHPTAPIFVCLIWKLPSMGVYPNAGWQGFLDSKTSVNFFQLSPMLFQKFIPHLDIHSCFFPTCMLISSPLLLSNCSLSRGGAGCWCLIVVLVGEVPLWDPNMGTLWLTTHSNMRLYFVFCNIIPFWRINYG